MKIFIILSIVLVLVQSTPKVFDISGDESVSVGHNSHFELKFDSNPTTGYDWYLINHSDVKDNGILRATNINEHGGGKFVRNSVPEGMVGVGGHTIFSFKALGENESEILEFSHYRPWEPISTAVQNATVEVKIGQSNVN